MGVVYLAINRINGKKYVGKTIQDFESRKDSHKRSGEDSTCDWAFARAIRKYGFDVFEWEIIFEGKDEVLDKIEIDSIKHLNTKIPNGYNMTDGGEGRLGYEVSVQTVAKIVATRMANGGYAHSEEAKQKVSQANKGKKRSEAFKKRVSEVHTGRKDSPETIELKRQARLGKKHSEETKKIISRLRKGKTYKEIYGDRADEVRQSHSEGLKRHHAENPETRRQAAIKSSKAQKGRKFTVEHREKMRQAALRRTPMSEETRRKLSESMKRSRSKKKLTASHSP